MTLQSKPVQVTAVVLLAFFWAINWPIMKIGLTVVEPWTFRAVIVVIGGLGCLALAAAFRLPLSIPRADLVPLLWLTLFQGVLWNAFSGFGIAMVEASRASVLGFTMPIWATLISIVVMGEKVTPRRLAGLGLGIAALILLLIPVLDNVTGRLNGALLMIAGAICWAIATVMIKAHDWRMPVLTLTAWQFLLGAGPLILAALTIGEPASLARIDARAGWALAYSAIVPMVFCQAIWFTIARRLPTSLASTSTLMVPPLGVLSAAVMLGERIGPLDIAALLVVLLAMLFILPGFRLTAWRRARVTPPRT